MTINLSGLFYVILKMSWLSNMRLMAWTAIYLFQSINCIFLTEKNSGGWYNLLSKVSDTGFMLSV